MDISIIIVSFNTKDLLQKCLESITNSLKRLPYNSEVIVVDNNSHDGSKEIIKNEFPDVIIIENEENLGYSKACNIGIKKSNGKYILLLNSDTIIFEDTIREMIKFMEENPKIGVSTCRVELPDGKLDPACHRGFPTPWASFTYFSGLEKIFSKNIFFSGYHQTYKDFTKPHEIDACSGAFFLIRKKVTEEVGLLDEDYFMYGEDLDWCYRIKQKGWKLYFNPNVKIIHLKKKSGRSNNDEILKKETTKHFYKTMELFYIKHYKNKYPWIVTKFVFLAINFRKLLS